MFKTLRSKLVVAFALVALLPLSVAAVHRYWDISRSLKAEALSRLSLEADHLADMMEDWLSDLEEDLHLISQSELLQDLIQARDEGKQAEAEHWREDLQKMVLAFLEKHGRYYQIRYIDERGVEVVGAHFDGTAVRISRTQAFQAADSHHFAEAMKLAAGQIYISPLHLSREREAIVLPHRSVIYYATPVFNESGQRRGGVIISAFGRKLIEDNTGLVGYSEEQILLIDQEGYYAAHPDPAKEFGGPRDLDTGQSVWKDYPEPVAARLLSGAAGALDDGRGNLGGVAQVKTAEGKPLWSLVVLRPARGILAPITQHQRIDLAYSAGGLALGIAVALLFSRQLTRGLVALERGAQAIAAGDFGYHIPVRTGDEMERVAEAFHVMTHRLGDAYAGTVRALASSVEMRDEYTGRHIARVAGYGIVMAEELGLDEAEISRGETGLILHDIGKLHVSDAILGKPGPLTEEEGEEMKRHVEYGARIVSPVPFLRHARDVVLYHHERFDGTGYQAGLSGEEIPLMARIMSVADAFDAMTTDRPYRKALPIEQALRELREGAGSQFDPQVVEAFYRAWEKGRIQPIMEVEFHRDQRAI